MRCPSAVDVQAHEVRPLWSADQGECPGAGWRGEQGLLPGEVVPEAFCSGAPDGFPGSKLGVHLPAS